VNRPDSGRARRNATPVESGVRPSPFVSVAPWQIDFFVSFVSFVVP
jgi:hypothetical protein